MSQYQHFYYRNLAVVLVESGLASVMPGRPGEERSMDFEVLLMAETKAKGSNKGVHAPTAKAPVRRINDLCVDSEDSKLRAVSNLSSTLSPNCLLRTKLPEQSSS